MQIIFPPGTRVMTLTIKSSTGSTFSSEVRSLGLAGWVCAQFASRGRGSYPTNPR
jgi:hypothetical protein